MFSATSLAIGSSSVVIGALSFATSHADARANGLEQASRNFKPPTCHYRVFLQKAMRIGQQIVVTLVAGARHPKQYTALVTVVRHSRPARNRIDSWALTRKPLWRYRQRPKHSAASPMGDMWRPMQQQLSAQPMQRPKSVSDSWMRTMGQRFSAT